MTQSSWGKVRDVVANVSDGLPARMSWWGINLMVGILSWGNPASPDVSRVILGVWASLALVPVAALLPVSFLTSGPLEFAGTECPRRLLSGLFPPRCRAMILEIPPEVEAGATSSCEASTDS